MIPHGSCAWRAGCLILFAFGSICAARAQDPPPTDAPAEQAAGPDRESPKAEAKSPPNWRAFWTGKAGARSSDRPAETAPGEEKLRFSFRFQPWADVLTWFADRADLSLVLDAPPSGTFNYTDSRSYTTSEAIDLLNGVLLSKGYTLVRRDRMLLLLPLEKGVPRDLLPQVSPEELAARGSNELVTVLLPLGNRDAAETANEVQPLLGPYGEAKALPKTRQLLLTGAAGKLRRAAEMIASIPEPAAVAAAPGAPAERPVLETHPLGKLGARQVLEMTRNLLPDSKAILDERTGQLLVIAVPSQQAILKGALALMSADTTPDRKPMLKSYEVRGGDLGDLVRMLRESVPEAQFMADGSRGRILAMAPQADQDRIGEMISTAALSTDEKPKLVMYPVNNADPQSIEQILGRFVPGAKVTPDRTAKQIAALATTAEHELIRQTLEQIEASATGATLERYDLQGADASLAVSMLQSAVPEGRFVADVRGGAVLAWARPEAHQSISEQIAKLSAKESGGQPIVKTYRPKRADVAALATVVSPQTPYARLTIDARTGTLVATATPAEHETIAAALAQLDAEDAAGGAVLKRYDLAAADPTLTTQMLQVAVPEARFTADVRGGAVLAWAKPELHEAIAENLKQLDAAPATGQPTVKVYRPERADVYSLYTAMATQTPYARLSLDTRTGSLVATATAKEHELIAGTLRELDAAEADGKAPRLEVYEMRAADPSNAMATLRTLFGSRTDIQLSYDAKTRKLLVRAPEEQQQIVRDVLEEVDGSADADAAAQLMVHSLGAADPTTALSVVTELIAKAPEAKVIGDGRAGQLAVMARPELQSSIKAAIAELQASSPEVEVLPLSLVDPFDAAEAIDGLFVRSRGSLAPPTAQPDPQNSRLLVRGTKDQLVEIRRLLAQMGEPLAEQAGSGKRLRVISLPGRDTEALVSELQRLWPSVGRNPIRVVVPSAVAPTLRQTAPEVASPPPAEPAAPAQADPTQGKTSAYAPLWLLPALIGAPQEEPPGEEPQPAVEPQPPADSPPIVIAPGPGGITIASDDPEALDRLESLLRTLAAQNAAPGREFTIFPLKNAPADSVAELLRRIYGGGPFGGFGFGSGGSVSVVADSRLNAVIVKAGPNDLKAIEGLLQVLDSADVPSTSITTRIERIPVKNTDAAEVAQVLRDTFKTALTSSVSRQQLPMARGVSRDVAALLDELNRSARGPEMTISVDERTNSLLVLAPEPLLKEVRSVVEQLDAAAEGAPRSVRIMRLQHTSAEAVEQALRMLSDEPGAFGGRRGRRNRSGQ